MSPPPPEHPRPRYFAALDLLFHPVDAASLVVVRVAFGVLMALLTLRFFFTGQLERLYLAQTLHFRYPFFGWLPDLSPGALMVVFALVGLSGVLIALGLLYRVACATFLLSWGYIFFFDQTAYQNHDYLACLLGFLFLLMPLNRSWSVDSRIWPATRQRTVPAWCLYVFRFQIAVVYVFGGIRKLNPDWFRGEPIRSMLHAEAFEHPWVGGWFLWEPLVWAFAWGGLFFDLLIVPALLWRVTRVPAFVVAVVFHLTNAWLWDIDVFPWFMIVATLSFFPPDYPRRLAGRLASATQPQTPDAGATGQPPTVYSGKQKALVLVLAVYVLVQVVLPLRPFLHTGHSLAQQDLLVFSWNMMLRLKDTRLAFVVVDNDSGERWKVPPEAILSDFQLGRLGSPDMMHQAAEYVADRSRAEGHPNVSVYLDAQHRLNARDWQVAYDPTIDLAATPRTLGPKSWVMPLEEPTPPDPAPRTAYLQAKWAFCKAEGLLPLSVHAGDSEVARQLREWATVYHGGHRNSANGR